MNHKANNRMRKNFVNYKANKPSSSRSFSHFEEAEEKVQFVDQKNSFCASFSAGYGFNSTKLLPETEAIDESSANWRLKQIFSGRPPANLRGANGGKRPQSSVGKTFPCSSTPKNFVPAWKKAKMMKKQMAEVQQSHKNSGQWAKVFVGDMDNLLQKKKKSKNKKRKSEEVQLQPGNGAGGSGEARKKRKARQQIFESRPGNYEFFGMSDCSNGWVKKNKQGTAKWMHFKERQIQKKKEK